MSEYTYIVNNYHAIKSARISLNGITVLSGENGCGKSTLSRWLYYLINGSHRYEGYVHKRFCKTMLSELKRLSRVAREIGMDFVDENRSVTQRTTPSVFAFERFVLRDKSGEESVDLVKEYFLNFIDDFHQKLARYLQQPNPDARKKRIIDFLGDEAKNGSIDMYSAMDVFHSSYEQKLVAALNNMQHELKNRPLNILLNSISEEYDEDDSAPKEIELIEDGVGMIENNAVSELFNLRRAIYVDTPLSISSLSFGNVFWEELKKYVNESTGNAKQTFPQKKLLHRINSIMQGEAKYKKYESPFDEGELRYVSVDRHIDIDVDKTATGYKTFIYLQRLLENGYLDNETLLLIDEPEVHLHPQWIVEYARLLVLLNKELGVKIMLASHNPDMVAAIRSIAEYEGVLSNTRFYIARRSQPDFQYVFEDIGTEIGEIFSSFNIALSRIQAYGCNSIQ